MYGLSEVQTGDKRNIPAVLKGLVRMPLATMPWWKSLQVMNENKGVFGLNMLKWWDDEGLTAPSIRLRPGSATAATSRWSPRRFRSTRRRRPTASSPTARTSARSSSRRSDA